MTRVTADRAQVTFVNAGVQRITNASWWNLDADAQTLADLKSQLHQGT